MHCIERQRFVSAAAPPFGVPFGRFWSLGRPRTQTQTASLPARGGTRSTHDAEQRQLQWRRPHLFTRFRYHCLWCCMCNGDPSVWTSFFFCLSVWKIWIHGVYIYHHGQSALPFSRFFLFWSAWRPNSIGGTSRSCSMVASYLDSLLASSGSG